MADARLSSDAAVRFPDAASLVRHLLSLRQKSQTTYVARGADDSGPTTQSICANYSGEGYGSMNQDVARNKFFLEAIKHAKATAPEGTWLEIGCGASALLTKMAMESKATIVAIEGNPDSAAIASRMLKQCEGSLPGKARVVAGFAGVDLGAVRTTDKDKDGFTAVLFEIFGFIASVEGVVAALGAVREAYQIHPSVRSVPSRALTRIVPVDVDVEALARDTATLYSSPKLLLAKRYALGRDSLCACDASGVGTFEDVDCASLLSRPPPEARTLTSELRVARPGVLSGLALYVVLQAECPKPRRWPDSAFGDSEGDAATGEAGRKLIWTTSNRADSQGAVSTNWLNPILLLPAPVPVEAGKAITLKVTAHLTSLSPHYRVQCAYNGEPVADLELAFADLYPDFDKLQAENAPVAAAAALPQEEASAPAADRPLPAAAARPQA
jgi:hypothetical protein